MLLPFGFVERLICQLPFSLSKASSSGNQLHVTFVGGLFFPISRFAFVEPWFLLGSVGQQPENIGLVCGFKFLGLFKVRICQKLFINKSFKSDSQRSAVLVANLAAVFNVALSSVVGRCSPLNSALR
ncbi:hypothetical protein ELS82_22935 [Vibrio ouci]|uniref:Uncharacterized protein n=1 Tax=Vibrio ouci TaxID=2499078 RepID=A0A4Y8W8P6_9VIBR|nr:hypothetical protein ELS82_22935 [Vibrio ouci]